MGSPHSSVEIPGMPRSQSNGMNGKPLGLGNDPLKVFQVAQENGETILKISGQIYGGLTTLETYQNYHFRCEFRWGEKKWAPRSNKLRDSGILFHCVGEHGKFWNVWMQSLECQIQEGDCGDFIGLAGAKATIPIIRKEGQKRPFYSNEGTLSESKYVKHSPSEEKSNGEWNIIEIYTLGQHSIFLVNGTPNMVLLNATQQLPDEERKPLTAGKIQIQSEGAEIDYRRIKLRPIEAFPEELKALVEKHL